MTTNTFAGFWIRAAAASLDCLLLGSAAWISGFSVPVLGPILVVFLYKPVLEASRAKATVGKRLLGLQVVTLEGARIGPRAALIRFVLSGVSGLFFLIGHLAMLFTERRQTVHDLVADTVVVYGSNAEPMFQAWIDELKSWFNGGFSRT